MPLTFDSLSHGSISFGFFNIESDMLLCDRYFLFADDFCENLKDIAEWDEERSYQAQWPVQIIESAADIGDLMGAIHGVRFSGFLGDLYRRFPFPQNPADFKQNPRDMKLNPRFLKLLPPTLGFLKLSLPCRPGAAKLKLVSMNSAAPSFRNW